MNYVTLLRSLSLRTSLSLTPILQTKRTQLLLQTNPKNLLRIVTTNPYLPSYDLSSPTYRDKYMESWILPISHSPSSSSSPFSSSSSTSPLMATKTMSFRGDEDQGRFLLLSSPSLCGEKCIEKIPLLSRALSYTSTSGNDNNMNLEQQRRQRINSDNSLLHYLGVGYRWITTFLALGFYAMLLFPGFVKVGYYYFFSSQVRRGIVYGDQRRNRLDLYVPASSNGPKPVVAFVTGGAWIIGNKAWGALLGQQLAERDIIVACIDYRNFPQGTISDMVKDTSQGISYVCSKIAEHGGDPNRIYLMGQSAGAHIAACVLLDQAIKESGEKETVSWSLSQINAYFGLSGGYNLLNLADYFHTRGLYRSLFLRIMEGEESLQKFSPEVVVQDPSIRNTVSLLPPIILFHGTADYSIPSDASKMFADALRKVGAQAELILYEGKTHTDLFLQDPMRGGRDELLENIVAVIHAGDEEALAKDAIAPPRKRLVPDFMLNLAGKISPF